MSWRGVTSVEIKWLFYDGHLNLEFDCQVLVVHLSIFVATSNYFGFDHFTTSRILGMQILFADRRTKSLHLPM